MHVLSDIEIVNILLLRRNNQNLIKKENNMNVIKILNQTFGMISIN